MPKVLVLLPEGFEEIETFAPVDVLRRAGAQVVVAALAEGIHTTGRCGVTVHADTTLTPAAGDTYDLLFIPGGPGVKVLRADPRVVPLVKAQYLSGRWVAAICAAPTVLLDAGLLQGRRFTAHTSVHAELPARLANEKVVVDGNLVTSRGAGTALEFGLVLVSLLFSPEKSAEIAAAICV